MPIISFFMLAFIISFRLTKEGEEEQANCMISHFYRLMVEVHAIVILPIRETLHNLMDGNDFLFIS